MPATSHKDRLIKEIIHTLVTQRMDITISMLQDLIIQACQVDALESIEEESNAN